MLTVAAYARDALAPLDEVLRFAQDAELAQVQLAWEQSVRAGAVLGGSCALGAAGVDAVLERLRGAGVELVGIDATAFDCLDAATFERHLEDLGVQMRAAKRLGAGCLTITAGPRAPANFAHLADGLARLAGLADRLGVGVSIRNLNNSSVEQLDDVHRLFRGSGVEYLTLDLDMFEFQAAVVNPHDAAVCFPGRVARVRACDVNLQPALAALVRDGYAGVVLAAVEDGVAAAEECRHAGRWLEGDGD